MKYTTLYLKYLLVVVLLIITVVMLMLGVLCLGLGIFGTAQEGNTVYLVFLPIGLVSGFLGFVALDCFKYFMDKWRLKDV